MNKSAIRGIVALFLFSLCLNIALATDTTPPTFTITSPADGTTYTNVTLDLNWTGDEILSQCAFSLNGAPDNDSICPIIWTGLADTSAPDIVDGSVTVTTGNNLFSMALDSNNYPQIVYQDETSGFLKYARWNGTAWELSNIDGITATAALAADLVLDASDFPHVSYSNYTGSQYVLLYAKWNGTDWEKTVVDSATSVGQFNALDLNSTDSPYIIYSDNVNSVVKQAFWNGSSWEISNITNSTVITYVDFKIDSADNRHVSFYNASNGRITYGIFSGSWSFTSLFSGLQANSLAIDTGNNPHLACINNSNNNLTYAYYDSVWHTETLGTQASHVSLVLDSNNYPRINYQEWTNDDSSYAKWNGTSWNFSTIESAGTVGNYVRSAITSNDSLQVIYLDVTNNDLKFATQSANPQNITLTASLGVNTLNVSGKDMAGNGNFSFIVFNVTPALSCGDNITTSTTLTANLTGCTGNGLNIAASNLVLDCNGSSVEATGNNYVGINVTGYNNITIQNCNINMFDTSILLSNSNNSNIINNNITSDWNGLTLSYSNFNILSSNNIINSNNYGIIVKDSSRNNTLLGNNDTCSGSGLVIGLSMDVSDYNQIINNTVKSCTSGANVYFSNDVLIQGNNLSNNNVGGSQAGVFIWGSSLGTIIKDNHLTGNAYGVLILDSGSTGTLVYHNNIFGNSVRGVSSAVTTLELSNGSEGNYWGRSTCPLFIPETTDSDNLSVVDSYPYNASDGWLSGSPQICAAALSCGDTINTSRTLSSSDNLTDCAGNGLNITASNVVLDCAGYNISGDYAGSGYGIYVPGNNVTITNCTIYGFNDTDEAGIYIDSGSNNTIQLNILFDNYDGIMIDNGYNNNIVSNYLYNNYNGIHVNQATSSGNTITGNTINDHQHRGIWVSGDGSIITNNIINHTILSDGIFMYIGNTVADLIQNNSITYSGNFGLDIGSSYQTPMTIVDNTITNTSNQGLYIADVTSKVIFHNNIYNNNGGPGNYQVTAGASIELSNGSEGNFWGHNSCPLFIEGTDSNMAGIVDSYAYNDSDGWNIYGSPPVCALPLSCGDTINTSRTLSGSDNLTDCAGDGLSITASDVVLNCNGFSINGTGNGAGVSALGLTNITIQNCLISNFTDGIFLSGTNESNLINNTVLNDSDSGIYLDTSSGNLINGGEAGNNCQNTVSACSGIRLSASINNIITGVRIHDNLNYYAGIGIYLYSNNNTIENNNIYANSVGIAGDVSGTLLIQNNNITNSSFDAGISLHHVNYSSILNNTIENNNGAGIDLNVATGNNISGNSISENTEGISLLSSTSENVWHNNIYNNSIYQLVKYSTGGIEISFNNEGNYWGRNTCPLFIAGTDSNLANVTDSFPYNSSDGWLSGSPQICDFTVPTVSISRPASGANISGGIFSYNINGTASDNINVSEVNLSINGVIFSAEINGTNWNYTWATTSDGLYNITAIAYDFDGNNATDTVTGVIVDNTAPSVTIITPTATITSSTFTLNVSITSSDAAFCYYTLDANATQIPMTSVSNTSCTGPELTIPNSAGNNITFYISDRYSNTNVTLVNFTVNDTTAPSVTGRNVSVTVNSAVINWTTDENSNGSIKVGNNNITVTSLVKTHSVSITGLLPSTNYRYNITSCDINNNCQTQGIYSFTTSASAAGGSNQSTSGGGSMLNSYLTLPFNGETRNTIQNGGTYNYRLSGQNSGDSHKIRVIAIDGKSVLLEFSSTPIKLTFNETETKQIDLDNDNQKDVEFTVEEIFANSIRFRLKNLLTEENTTLQASVETNKTNETVKTPVALPATTGSAATASQPSSQATAPSVEKEKINWSLIAIVTLVAVIIGVIIVSVARKNRYYKRYDKFKK